MFGNQTTEQLFYDDHTSTDESSSTSTEQQAESTSEISFEEELEGLPDAHSQQNYILCSKGDGIELCFMTKHVNYLPFHPDLHYPPPRG